MAETNNKKQREYINFIIKSDRVIKENEKFSLIKYSDNQTFWYPKALICKLKLNTNGEYLFTKLSPNEPDDKYLQLSFKAKQVPYLNQKGEYKINDFVEISSKLHGKLDEFGSQEYKKSKMSLWDLKKYFADESTKLINFAKKQKEQSNNNEITNSQALIQE